MKRLAACSILLLAAPAVPGSERVGPSSNSHPAGPQTVSETTAAGPKLPPTFPAAAEAYAGLKRGGLSSWSRTVRAYERAHVRLDAMEVVSNSRRGIFRRPFLAAAEIRGSWESLGPGNIGGRTRTLVIDPTRTRRMLSAGVSGGIWKSTNRGRRWRAVGDQLSNLAVNALALDPNDSEVVWAGTGEGFFREEVRATSLPLRGAGVFRSRDFGESWEQIATTVQRNFRWVNDLVVSHSRPGTVYAATRTGVWRTQDNGETWQRIYRSRIKGGCLDLAIRRDLSTDTLFASCGSLTRGRVVVTRDAAGAARWTRVLFEPGMGRTSLAIAPSDPSVVYALAASNVAGPNGQFEQGLHAVYRSDQSGAVGSWRAVLTNRSPSKVATMLLSNPVINFVEECGFTGTNHVFNMGWYANFIAVDPADEDIVWAGGVDLFRSDDGGRTWSPASYWWADGATSVHADQHGVVFDPRYNGRSNQRMFILNDGGIYRTVNARRPLSGSELAVCSPAFGTVTYRSLNNSLGITQFYHGTVLRDGRTFLGGTQDNGTLLGTTNALNGWRGILGGDGGYSAQDPTQPNVLYASVQGGRIFRSDDGGLNFNETTTQIADMQGGASDFRAVPANFLFIAPFLLDSDSPSQLWLGGRRLWASPDRGGSWSPSSPFFAEGAKASALATAPGSSARLLAGTDRGWIYRNANATVGDASSWEAVLPRRGFVSSVAIDPTDPSIAYATYAGFGGAHVWRTVDGGATWNSIDGSGDSAVPDAPVHSIVVDPGNSQRLFLGTDLGVLVSTDGGESWAVENTGFARTVTEHLALSPDGRYLAAFTHGRGVWRAELN